MWPHTPRSVAAQVRGVGARQVERRVRAPIAALHAAVEVRAADGFEDEKEEETKAFWVMVLFILLSSSFSLLLSLVLSL